MVPKLEISNHNQDQCTSSVPLQPLFWPTVSLCKLQVYVYVYVHCTCTCTSTCSSLKCQPSPLPNPQGCGQERRLNSERYNVVR